MARKSKQQQDAYYVQYVIDSMERSKDAEQELRKGWDELWQVYQSKQDNSRKADWQSKAFAPKIFMQIEKSAGEIKRAILQTSKLFKFEMDDYDEKLELEQLQHELTQVDAEQPGAVDQMGALAKQIDDKKREMRLRATQMALVEKKFKRALKKTNLRNIYPLVTKEAFLLGIGVPKVLWDAKKGGCKFEHVDRINTYISPDYQPFQHERPPDIVEYKRMPLARLKKLAKEAKKAGAEGWDFAAIKKLEGDVSAAKEKTKERQRRGQGDIKPHKAEVDIHEFWGDVINEDNTDIEENVLLVVVNKQYLIRKHENPFVHGKTPYPLVIPVPFPHRGQCGTSLAAPLVRMQYVYNNILNMWIDNLNFSINKVFQFNSNNVSAKDLTSIYPGKKIPVSGSDPAISEVPISAVGSEPIKALEAVDRVMQEGSNVTEYVAGYPGSKGKETLGEVELKTAQSRGLFDVIARDMEENSIKELLEMAYDLYTQFDNYPPREDFFTILVGGVSLQLQRKELVQQIGEVLMLALQDQQLNGMTEINDLWKKFLGIYNMDEAYIEPDTMANEMRPEQMQAIQGKAEEDAKRDVAEGRVPQDLVGGV